VVGRGEFSFYLLEWLALSHKDDAVCEACIIHVMVYALLRCLSSMSTFSCPSTGYMNEGLRVYQTGYPYVQVTMGESRRDAA
jgi:hypothetical protein